jgi:hypothetical protein
MASNPVSPITAGASNSTPRMPSIQIDLASNGFICTLTNNSAPVGKRVRKIVSESWAEHNVKLHAALDAIADPSKPAEISPAV